MDFGDLVAGLVSGPVQLVMADWSWSVLTNVHVLEYIKGFCETRPRPGFNAKVPALSNFQNKNVAFLDDPFYSLIF